MNHCGTKTIKTERLILRRFLLDDAEVMFRNWASDPDVAHFLTWTAHESIDDTKSVLQDWIASYQSKDTYNWAIVPKVLDEPIGSISVVEYNDDLQLMHIGYCIGKLWWHQGITSESLQAVIAYLFEKTDVNRIESRHDPRNPNSGGVMRKCGMQYEGTLRQADRNIQGICDYSMYAILRQDFQTMQAEKHISQKLKNMILKNAEQNPEYAIGNVSHSLSGAVRQFSYWVAHGTVGYPLLEGIDYLSDMKECSSIIEAAYAIFMNNLRLDVNGKVINYRNAENRAAQYLRGYYDPSYLVEPPIAFWECELYEI